MNFSTIVAIMTLLIATSATYNAYLLRGGRLAVSELLIAISMVFLMFSEIIVQFLPNIKVIQDLSISDLIFLGGLVILLLASLKLRLSIK